MAMAFKEVFERCAAEKADEETDGVSGPDQSAALPAEVNTALTFKTPEESWSCSTCLLPNERDATECIACGSSRPDAEAVASEPCSATATSCESELPAAISQSTGEGESEGKSSSSETTDSDDHSTGSESLSTQDSNDTD